MILHIMTIRFPLPDRLAPEFRPPAKSIVPTMQGPVPGHFAPEIMKTAAKINTTTGTRFNEVLRPDEQQ